MKKSLKPFMLSLFILCFMAFAKIGLAQEPPHPPSDKGTSTNQSPAATPIGNGLTILLAMGAAYGAFKVYQMRRKVLITE
jgi:hypothetical protein